VSFEKKFGRKLYGSGSLAQKKLKFEIWWNLVHRLLRNLASKLATLPYKLKVKCPISNDESLRFLFFEMVKCMNMNTFRTKTSQISAKFGRISSNIFKFLRNPDFYLQISGVWQKLLIWNFARVLILVFFAGKNNKKLKFHEISSNFVKFRSKVEKNWNFQIILFFSSKEYQYQYPYKISDQ